MPSIQEHSEAPAATCGLVKLNWGCGAHTVPGWLNADVRAAPGVDLVLEPGAPLPLANASVECIVGMHVLQDLSYAEILPALRELRRVLKRGGWLRLGLPDLDRALQAYRSGDAGYFYVPDEHARSVGAKLVTQITWYGSVRTPFNFDFAHEALRAAGFRSIRRCDFGVSQSGIEELASLDNRRRESLFVEATK